MNRRQFFKKLGIGVAVVIVAPRVLIPPQKAVLTTGGVIPYIARQGKLKYTFHRLSQPSIISNMNPYMDDIQMSWLRMQVALEKRLGERQRAIDELILYGQTTIKS